MPTRRTRIILSLVVLATIALTACSGASNSESLVKDRCNACHNLDRITDASKSRDEWQATVDRMITRGAVLDDAERETVIDYLTETYP